MPAQSPRTSASIAALTGIIALASAMGIGRFALTPILPLMQTQLGLTLAGGSWLASANYLGYLVGALSCMVAAPAPPNAIRLGLVGCAILTLAMALTDAFWAWIALRFLAGGASALVLVGVAAWTMPILTRDQREAWSGRVFSGVGAGIAFAGSVGLLASIARLNAELTWIILGISAAMVALVAWRLLVSGGCVPQQSFRPTTPTRPSGKALLTAACYVASGYAYIIPATFLPAIARAHIETALFGCVWPVFGIAAALSTLLIEWIDISPRRLWLAAQLLLAAGVIAPIFAIDMTTLLIAALCVGGSFMVITMSGLKEILRMGGAEPSQLVGMMTSGFAIGQIAGPLTVALLPRSVDPLLWAAVVAATLLFASSCALAAGLRDEGSSVAARAKRHSLGLRG